MFKDYFTECFLLSLVLNASKCARILCLSTYPTYSHQLVFKIICKELCLRGHEVVQFTVKPSNNTLKKLTEIDISFLLKYVEESDFENADKYSRLYGEHLFTRSIKGITDEVFTSPQMQRILADSNEHFDLVVVEMAFTYGTSVLSRKFNCPFIGIRSVGLRLEEHDILGNPTNPSYLPKGWADKGIGTFWGRMDNLIQVILYRIYHYIVIRSDAQELKRKHFPDVKESPLEVTKNVSLVLLNTHPVLLGARPYVPSVVEIGGVHLNRKENIIPQDVEDLLDRSTRGTILVSFGTILRASKFNERFKNVLLNCFRKLPYTIIWKWNGEAPNNLPRNVYTWNWLPQEEILAHENVKLFITHAGLLSFQEAVDKEVPMIAIPFFSDQFLNAHRIKKLGIGESIDRETVKENELLRTISEVIRNPKYKRNIEAISRLFKDQPMKPMEKAMWWIEYVIRHGNVHLRSEAIDLTWIQYFNIDVLLFLVVFSGCSVVLLHNLIKCSIKMYKAKVVSNNVKKSN